MRLGIAFTAPAYASENCWGPTLALSSRISVMVASASGRVLANKHGIVERDPDNLRGVDNNCFHQIHIVPGNCVEPITALAGTHLVYNSAADRTPDSSLESD